MNIGKKYFCTVDYWTVRKAENFSDITDCKRLYERVLESKGFFESDDLIEIYKYLIDNFDEKENCMINEKGHGIGGYHNIYKGNLYQIWCRLNREKELNK